MIAAVRHEYTRFLPKEALLSGMAVRGKSIIDVAMEMILPNIWICSPPSFTGSRAVILFMVLQTPR
jgi:hypothetical protein